MRSPSFARAIGALFRSPQPVLILLAGPNGAGKSTFFDLHVRPVLGERLPFINADNIAAAIRASSNFSPVEVERVAFREVEARRRLRAREPRSEISQHSKLGR